MIINIFGVGRSGTKSLQLFIAYALLQQYQEIRINYEPYFWASRLLEVKSFEGIQHHLTTKHFTNNLNDFSKKHQQYLRDLCEGKVVLNKFIRANGRIGPIAAITKADYNILLIRDVSEVINSINKKRFNFHSIGTKYPIDYYDDLLKDAKEEGLREFLKTQTKDEHQKDKNMIVWKAYNEHAKRNENLIIIDYSRLQDAKYLAKKLDFLKIDASLCREFSRFRGNKIHTEEVLKNKEVVTQNKLINQLLFYSLFRIVRQIPFLKETIKDITRLNHKIIAKELPISY